MGWLITLLWWGFLISVAILVFRVVMWIVLMVIIGVVSLFAWLVSLAVDRD
jgi:hypothetical protein